MTRRNHGPLRRHMQVQSGSDRGPAHRFLARHCDYWPVHFLELLLAGVRGWLVRAHVVTTQERGVAVREERH
jgi:hypothetical protein